MILPNVKWWAAAQSVMFGSKQQEAFKVTAFLLMILDHVAVVWPDLPGALALRTVGRLAFPMFGYLIAYNLIIRRVAPVRYLWPLALLAGLSQLPAALVLDSSVLNIYATLFAGVLAWHLLAAAESRRDKVLAVIAVVALLVLAQLHVDYGLVGVLLIPALAVVFQQPRADTLAAAGVVLFLLNPLWWWSVLPLLLPAVAMIFAGVRGVPRLPRWAWYAAYPGHLILLGVVRYIAA